ncbi:MAG: branched-chain amino acid ABC transporter permease [Actinobacteria bacterium]|nr:branched-chain amino acid ABC transporter permease [Actinomycetota bacterium]MBW3651639.1 branched-chain amino acid ABC transporter permease [Actinomycetota bacterium]
MTVAGPRVDLDQAEAAAEARAAAVEAEVVEKAKAEAYEAPFKPSPIGWFFRVALAAALVALVLVFPLDRPLSDVRLFSQAAIYAIIGLSLNVLLGYTGQISLGHQAFVGIGSFTSAYLVTVQQWPFAAAVAVAMAVGGLQALVLGGVALRIRGLYFALVTLSYGTVASDSLFGITRFTGGGSGQSAPLPSFAATPHRYYYFCLLVLAVVIWVDYRMMQTKGGRALLALRENPRVASTFGIDVKAYTLFAFVVAGVFAGLGGALLAHKNEVVQAQDYNFQLALIFVIMTVVGGLRSRSGVVIGSAFFALLSSGYLIEKAKVETLFRFLADNTFIPFLSKEVAALVLGPLLLLLTLTLYPGGIGQQIRPIQRWLAGHRFNLHDRGDKEVQISDVRA